jgi:2-dehydropantoate 2-reductase
VVRGPHLAAIREKGLTLQQAGTERTFQVRATDRMGELGQQDLVIIGLKSHQVAGVAAEIRGLCGPSTIVVTAQNGIPWWYFFKSGGAREGMTLESVDPGGIIAKNIDVDRVLGSIIYPAADIVSPGVIRHVEGDRISLGEIDGADTERLRSTVKLLRDAGFKVRVSSDLRSELWVKLWGNCTFNPISALTHATLDVICTDPATRALSKAVMLEAQAIAETFGVQFRVDVERRIEGARKVGAHKTSMLQDLERGRPMEIDPLVTVVQEMGRLTKIPTPALDAVLALVVQRARVAGLY